MVAMNCFAREEPDFRSYPNSDDEAETRTLAGAPPNLLTGADDQV
jgi:hypothetical protein